VEIAPIYIFVVAIAFVFIWTRHFYLVHFKLNQYMLKNHKFEWNKMKEDTSLYRLPWMNLYYTKAVYNFIWRSVETYGDENIHMQRLKICRFRWELPLYFVLVMVVTILFIWSGILK